MADSFPQNRSDCSAALAGLRLVSEARATDPGRSLRTATSMLDEARGMLLASKRHLQGASIETVFALGALSSQIEAVAASMRCDLDRIAATAPGGGEA